MRKVIDREEIERGSPDAGLRNFRDDSLAIERLRREKVEI